MEVWWDSHDRKLKGTLFIDNVLLVILKMISVGQCDIIKLVVFVLVGMCNFIR